MDEDFKFKPAALIAYAKNTNVLASISGTLYIKDIVGLGAGYRTDKQMSGILSYTFDYFRLGYSYQVGTSSNNFRRHKQRHARSYPKLSFWQRHHDAKAAVNKSLFHVYFNPTAADAPVQVATLYDNRIGCCPAFCIKPNYGFSGIVGYYIRFPKHGRTQVG